MLLSSCFEISKRFNWLKSFIGDAGLLRASASVALNVAEGPGKKTAKEQRRFYAIALGSLRESQAIIELERIADPTLNRLLDELGAVLYTLCRENRSCTATETETEN